MSGLGVDQAHEQNNRIVKEDGAAIGLTENPIALRRWMLAGPEVTNLIKEFRAETDDEEDLLHHHEQYNAFQLDFLAKCSSLKGSFDTFSNPFLECLENLIALDTRVYASKEGQRILLNAKQVGQVGRATMQNLIDERLCSNAKVLYDRIPKNKCQIFSMESNKRTANGKVKELKYENHVFPPALSVNGRLRSGEKYLLLQKLLQRVPKHAPPTRFDGIIFDGAAVNGEEEFLGYITSQASVLNSERADVVWDQYFEGSTKACTREERGVGIRRQVLPRVTLPANWHAFLRHAKNKEELFSFLASLLVNYNNSDTKLKFLTNVNDEIRGNSHVVSCLVGTSCSSVPMEEADGRIILHVFDMIKSGLQDVLIRTVDTDVLVLAISFYHKMREQGLITLWVKLGTGANESTKEEEAMEEAGEAEPPTPPPPSPSSSCKTTPSSRSSSSSCCSCSRCKTAPPSSNSSSSSCNTCNKDTMGDTEQPGPVEPDTPQSEPRSPSTSWPS
ncbi:hypothetical protein FOCC_FOCC017082, partial [Frankliniella occidentalis]